MAKMNVLPDRAVRAVIVCFLGVIFQQVAGAAEAPSPKEIADGIRRYITESQSFQFELNVNASFWPSPKFEVDANGNMTATGEAAGTPNVVKGKELFRILRSPKPGDRPWRYWQRSLGEAPNGDVSQFLGYNGEKFVFYLGRSDEATKDYNMGQVLPFENPTFYQENIFDVMISSDLNGIAEFNDPGWRLSQQIDNSWVIEGTRQFDSRTAYALRGHRGNIEQIVHVVPVTQGYLIVHREIFLKDQKDGSNDQQIFKWDVEALGELKDTFVYPSRGKFSQKNLDFQPGIEYAFNVNKVTRLDNSARQGWIPPWPTGTAVGDRVKDENYIVPHAPGQRKAISVKRGDKPRADIAAGGSGNTRTRAAFLILNIILVFTLAVWWLLRRRALRRPT